MAGALTANSAQRVHASGSPQTGEAVISLPVTRRGRDGNDGAGIDKFAQPVSLREYGIITPHSNTVLIVSPDRADAERALAWIPGGRIVARSITYSPWEPATVDALT